MRCSVRRSSNRCYPNIEWGVSVSDKKKWDLAALATIPLIMTLANSMLIPVLPLMQKKLSITPVQSSLIITVYAAVSIVCIPIAGYLSDRFGRKLIILIGLTIAAIGGIISGLGAWLLQEQGAYFVILGGRLVQGIGAAGAFPIVLPLVGDMYRSQQQISSGLGMIETSNTFGKVISPILGSALALMVWFLPLAVIPLFSAISIAAVAYFVKVPKPKKQKKESPAGLGAFVANTKDNLKQNRWLYAIFAIGGILMFVMFGFLYYLSSVLEEHYHIDGIWKGLVLAIPLCAICLSSFIAGKLVGENKSKMKWFTVIGAALLTASMLTCALVNTKSMVFLISLMFAGGVGIGFSLPSLDALITEGVEKEQRGTITSLYSSMRFIGVAAGPLTASALISHEEWLFYLLAAVALLCCVVGLFGIKPGKKKKAHA
ncbi:MFS transporter [Paenibacillus paeoniae]|uniref:MFS transporter n=1 Tax=Paenibacillus paeoniae TaxID=2292705 RepID=A0A371P677_9BACL|nr:MFS transporter [Paenibacillus paeoniae]REK71454.1 MFS transporter [Paenibacillus paeoniae]